LHRFLFLCRSLKMDISKVPEMQMQSSAFARKEDKIYADEISRGSTC
jgi:hypothetical protein